MTEEQKIGIGANLVIITLCMIYIFIQVFH